MEALEGTNREGHSGLAGVAYSRRAGNNGARGSPLVEARYSNGSAIVQKCS
jgi:hypothetical protein